MGPFQIFDQNKSIMTIQAAVFEPVPTYARHLFFELMPSAAPLIALQKLAAVCDGRSVVPGIGQPVIAALGKPISGLRGFPGLPHARPAMPSTCPRWHERGITPRYAAR